MPTPKSLKIQVSELQRSILEQLQSQRKSSVSEAGRSQIILEISKGLANMQVSQNLGVQYDRVQRWRKQWLSFQSAFAAWNPTRAWPNTRAREIILPITLCRVSDPLTPEW